MKKVNFFTVAATFAGCFLGAGYVSGQELKQFFGDYGSNWVLGLLVAVIAQLVLGVVILLVSRRTGDVAMDRVVVPKSLPWLRNFMGIAIALMLFVINVTMFAAFGAMLHQMTGGTIPVIVGSALLTLVVCVLALLGLRGMVAVFSMVVPILVVASIAICIAAVSKYGIHAPDLCVSDGTSIRGTWWVSAITFVSYNIFGSIGIMAPMGPMIPKKRTIFFGIASGAVALTAIAAGILLAMYSYPAGLDAQLPMVAVASSLSPVLGVVYAVLLFGGMLGTSLAGTVAIDIYIHQRKEETKKFRKPIIIAISVAGFAASLVGFSELVGTVYPLFGYCGLLAIAGLFINFFSSLKKKSKA